MATTATRRLRGLLALVLMLAVAACGDSTGPDEDNDAEHTFTIQNESSLTIDEVNLSPCTDTTWGGNDLDGTIAPGDSESWGFDSPQCLDVRVFATSGASAESYGIELDGEFTWTVTD